MKLDLVLPTLHPGQVRAYNTPGRFLAVRCGRRWGKTDLGKVIVGNALAKGLPCGWFAPDYKISSEAYNEIADMIEPIKKSSSKIDGTIRTIGGGRLDFWTLNNPRAGRSRKYAGVIIDEAAFTDEHMMDIWEKSIKPTLLDLGGWAVALSNTNGISDENFFYQICHEPKYGFAQYHAPTHENPYLPAEELEKLKRDNPPLVFAQEYLADFVDWSGVQFFSRDKLLVNGQPVEPWKRCDAVFAVIDSASKTGKEHDGTAAIYCAVSRTDIHYKLVVLDWDVVQIEGAFLEEWLPSVFSKLEGYAKEYGARQGSLGAWIEDKNSGTTLLQQSARRGLKTRAVPASLTAQGKDGRAIGVSGYVHRDLVKFSGNAYDKIVTYKGHSRNHLLSQVSEFRIGDPKAATREDDLLDAFVYAIALALGDSKGS